MEFLDIKLGLYPLFTLVKIIYQRKSFQMVYRIDPKDSHNILSHRLLIMSGGYERLLILFSMLTSL